MDLREETLWLPDVIFLVMFYEIKLADAFPFLNPLMKGLPIFECALPALNKISIS
jgi:hypothetical protein